MLLSNNLITPTSIQSTAIPTLLSKNDGLIGSQTGTGKTMTFLIPIIQNMIEEEKLGNFTKPNRPKILIIVPTRELGAQILAMTKSLCHHPEARFRAAFATGGESKIKQRETLKGELSFVSQRAQAQIATQEKYKAVCISVPIRHKMRELGMSKRDSRDISLTKAKWIYDNMKLLIQEGTLVSEDVLILHNTIENTRELSLTSNGAAVLNDLLVKYNTDANIIKHENDLQVSVDDCFVYTPTVIKPPHGHTPSEFSHDEFGAQGIEDANFDLNQEFEDEYNYMSEISSNLKSHLSSHDMVPSLEQIVSKNRNVDVVVGTPGRIRELIARDMLHLSELKSLVFDEADFLFEPKEGFVEDLEYILKPLNRRLFNLYSAENKKRAAEDPLCKKGPLTKGEYESKAIKEATNTQIIFAGATLQKEFIREIRKIFPVYRDPTHPRPFAVLQSKESMCLPENLRQTWVRLGSKDKLTTLKDMLSGTDFQKGERKVFSTSVLIFCNSIASSRAVTWSLNEAGIAAVGSHGDIPPKLRAQYWNDFLHKRVPVMVCTDLASRGLDTRFVSKIINFDFPLNPVTYLHRVGRTARAGDEGHVISLLTKGDEVLAKAIDRAHKAGSSIANLSSSLDVYRTDIPRALRPGAVQHEVKAFAPTNREVRLAIKDRLAKDRRNNQKVAAERRRKHKMDKHDLSIAKKQWNRSSGRGIHKSFDVSVDNKMEIIRRSREIQKYEQTHGKDSFLRDFKRVEPEQPKQQKFTDMSEMGKKKFTRRVLSVASEKRQKAIKRGDETKTSRRKNERQQNQKNYKEYLHRMKHGATISDPFEN